MLLSSRYFESNWALAGEMLKQFVLDFGSLYGERYMTSNVHNLQHVYDDVYFLGPLPSLSAYPFENELQIIKNMLRSGNNELIQVIKRLSELESFHINTRARTFNASKPMLEVKPNGNVILRMDNFILRNDEVNSFFLS